MRDARCDASIGRRRETRVATGTHRMGEFCFTSFRRVRPSRSSRRRVRPSYRTARRSSDRSIRLYRAVETG
jgi:hypothetical protein